MVYLSSCIACLVILSHFLSVCIFKYHAFPVLHSLQSTVQSSLSALFCALYLYVCPCALLNKIFTSVTVLARIDLPLAS